jgi:uncharacterized linocin/CFP29 family protein
MANKFLAREDAPFGEELWHRLDTAMIAAAKSQLAGRRLLDIEGPYGLGLKVIPLTDVGVDFRWKEFPEALQESTEAAEEAEDLLDESAYATEVMASGVIPVAMIRTEFTLGMRDIASHERDGVALDLGAVAAAAIAAANAEDDLLFNGSEVLGTYGLLNVPGTHALSLSAWKKPGEAADDIIKALTELDSSGFHGPYSLALAPHRYNLLYRRYPQGNQTELGHLQSMVTGGIFKASILKGGGVLLASGAQFATIVLGQDMSIGFIGPVAGEFEFSISESLALRVRQPGAICVLEG